MVLGAYVDSTPGVKFNLTAPYTSYPIPGPDVWTGVSGASGYGGP